MIPDLAWWSRLAALLAAEAALLAGIAALAARCLRPPQLQRAVWQACLLGIAIAWSAELAGLRSALPVWHPPGPTGRTLVSRNADAAPAPESTAADVAPATPAPAPARSPDAVPAVPLRWPAAVWATGFLLLALRALAGRVVVRIRVRRNAGPMHPDPTTAQAVERLRHALGLREVRLLRWPSLRGPVAFGVVRPTVALPTDFESRFAPEQQAAMLAHELAHLAGHDPLWMLLADLVCAFAWWHPAVWWARRRMLAAGESAADAASALVPGGRIALAESLVAFGHELAVADGIGVGGSGRASDLSRRVRGLLADGGTWRPVGVLRGWALRLAAGASAVGIASLPVALSVGGSPVRVLAQRPAPTPSVTAPVADPGPAPFTALLDTNRPLAIRPGTVLTARVPTSPDTTAAPDRTPPPPTPSNPQVVTNVVGYVVNADKVVVTGDKVVAAGSPVVAQLPAGTTPRESKADPLPPPVPPVPQILLQVRLVEVFRPVWSEEAGFDWIFGNSTNAPTSPTTGVPTALLPGAAGTNTAGLRLDHVVTSGRWTALSSNQLAGFVDALKRKGNVDFLSAPRVVTLSGRQAQVAVGDSKSLATGPVFVPASGTNKAAIQYSTLPVQVGPSIDLLPTLEPAGPGREPAFRIVTRARYTEFMGYAAPAKGTEVRGRDEHGRLLTGKPSLPVLRVREADAVTTCRPGEAVVLRGPDATNVVRTVDRVVGLGDVPLLGRLFTTKSVQTNVSQFYIVVEPVEVDPAGRRVPPR